MGRTQLRFATVASAGVILVLGASFAACTSNDSNPPPGAPDTGLPTTYDGAVPQGDASAVDATIPDAAPSVDASDASDAATTATDATVDSPADAADSATEDVTDSALPDVVLGDGGCTNYVYDGGPDAGAIATGTVVGRFCALGGGSVTFDSNGNAWISGYQLVVMRQDGVPLAVYDAGSGALDVVFGPNGHAFTTDLFDNQVAELDSKTGATLRTFNVGTYPEYAAFDPAGNLWVTNTNGNNLSEVLLADAGADGAVVPIGLSGQTGPVPLAFDHDGFLWVGDYLSNAISKVDSNGNVVGTVPGSAPAGIAVDSQGMIWVALAGSGSVTKLGPDGGTAPGFPVALGSGTAPHAVAFDKNGNAWVADENTNQVSEVSPTGALLGTFPTGGLDPYYVAVDPAGYVWVTNGGSANVSKIAP
jgi:streptogramin lyase